jgi:peptidoglycan/LPS O-acetylase OafA/YrhL
VAALSVLVFHGLGHVFPGYTSWLITHFNLGQAGVVLFLLVSGFIIPASLEQGGSNARFWLRRFFRLFPLYWLSIALGYLGDRVGAWSPLLEQPGDWLLNLTMLQGFFGRPNVWGVFWTLQLELVIYASCSLLYAAGLLKRADRIAILVFAGYALLGLTRPLLWGKYCDIGGQRHLYFVPLIGLIAQRYWSVQLSRRRFVPLVLAQPLLLAAVWLVNFALFPGQRTLARLWELGTSEGTAYVCFFLLLASRQRRMPELLCWLGRISYSVYLVHPALICLLGQYDWPALPWLAALVGLTLLVAHLSYRLVELPGIAAGRALERRWLPAPVRLERPPSRRAA